MPTYMYLSFQYIQLIPFEKPRKEVKLVREKIHVLVLLF